MPDRIETCWFPPQAVKRMRVWCLVLVALRTVTWFFPTQKRG